MLGTDQAHSPCWIHKLELEGFKSYQESSILGPFAPFSCVVGPNGCGKSVLGDAITFVLGSAGHNTVNRGLQACINDSLRSNTAAQSTRVRLWLMYRLDLGIPPHKCWIQRVIQRNKSIWSYQSGTGPPQTVQTQADLRDILLPFHIDTEVPDRFVVTQNRQAVGVQDPLKLAHHLEKLGGTAKLMELIHAKQQKICQLSQQCENLTDDTLRVEQQRKHLAPHVTRWKAYEARASVFQARKLDFMQQQADTSACSITATSGQVDNHQTLLKSAKDQADKLDNQLGDMTNEKKFAIQQHLSATKLCAKLDKQVDAAHENLARVQVRETAALQAAQQRSDADKSRQKHIKALQTQQNKARKQMVASTQDLEDQRASMQDLQQRVCSMQAEQGGDSCTVLQQVNQLQDQMVLAKSQTQAADASLMSHDAQLAACQQQLNQLCDEARAADEAAELERAKQAKQAATQAELAELKAVLHTKQAIAQALLTSHMRAQLGVQSLSDQVQAVASSRQQHQQAGSSKLDAAVRTLMQQESLQGKFHGRLSGLATIPAAQDEVPVNAVLKELCNMGNCLVVSDRQAAAQVVSYFKAHRVGTVNCKIIAELTKYDRLHSMLNAEEGLCPLIALIHVLKPECQCVYNSMLSNWYLIKDRQTAIRIIARDRKPPNGRFAGRNLVTEQGELFKADGEVVSMSKAGRSHGTQSYLLGQVANHQGSVHKAPPSDPHYLHHLQQCLMQQQEQVDNTRLQAETASSDMQGVQQQCAALESALKQAAVTPPPRRMAGRGQTKRQSDLAAKKQMLERLQLQYEEAAKQKHDAEKDLCQLQQKHTTVLASATAGGSSLADLLRLQSQLAAVNELCKKAEEEQQAADKAGKVASRRLALLESSSTAASSTDMKAAAHEQAAETAKLQQQLRQLQADLQAAAGQQQATHDALSSCQTQLSQCARALAAAAQQATHLQQALAALQQSLRADKLKYDRIMTALAAQSQQDSDEQQQQQQAEEEDVQQDRRSMVQGCKRLKKQTSRTQARSGHSIIVSDSESDTGMEGSNRALRPARSRAPSLRAAASRSSTGRHRQGRAGTGRAGQSSHGQGRANDMDCESEAAELAEEEATLDALKAGIDVAALEQDVAAALSLQELAAQLEHKEAALSRLHEEKQALEAQRLTKFCGAMKAVNGEIGPIYQKLTGGQGDAHLTFTEDALLLFTEGVHFHVRPDAHRSRPLASLSGGQQALATLALSFALQAAFPSPFYFFDEIDSALDTSNASRVADYIASQSGAQYLVVSHKPQVYERASCLVGVYTSNGSSRAVTLRVPEE